MRHQIALSDETLGRLKMLAEPFVDKEPEDVIRRLLDDWESRSSRSLHSERAEGGSTTTGRSAESRVPRERGTRVQIGDHVIEAISVRDLYKQALAFLVGNYKVKLQATLPYKTSAERYLVAAEPKHPAGNPFVVPVEFRGFYIEAHKDYKNAVAHLSNLCERLSLKLTYLG